MIEATEVLHILRADRWKMHGYCYAIARRAARNGNRLFAWAYLKQAGDYYREAKHLEDLLGFATPEL